MLELGTYGSKGARGGDAPKLPTEKKRYFLSLVLGLCLLAFACSAESVPSPLKLENGMLQPIFRITDLRDPDYTNEGSDILRFCVWVETDRDTDLDGKADLVKAFLQVPRAAVEGQYKAAVIYDPTPYVAGTVEEYSTSAEPMYVEEPFDYSLLDKLGEKRVPEGEMSSMEAAAKADPMEWNYKVPKSGEAGYYSAQVYDYYLRRGYALVLSCGIGTYGSEGFELCGTKQERDSHKSVVEWLTGDRRAFTDRTGKTEIRADWCNGCVAMTGTSYGGSIPFAVAVTGVKGLKTIVPIAGIASWYDYTNHQGVSILNEPHYADSLAVYNCGGTFLDEEWNEPNPKYGSWLWQISRDQDETNGDYAPIYEILDFTTEEENHIECSAMVVNGINDYNVAPDNANQMVQAFLKAGKNVKLVLHQNGHDDLANISINGQVWQEIMNKWLSHYLYGVENDAENFPAVLAQSNIDGHFEAYESWNGGVRTEAGFTAEETNTVTSEGLAAYTEEFTEEYLSNLTGELQEEFYRKMPEQLKAVYSLELPENTTILGGPEVHVTLTCPDEDLDGLMITAVLMDVSDQGTFPAYRTHGEEDESPLLEHRTIGKTFLVGADGEMDEMEEFVQENTAAKLVTFAWTDLANPGMGPEPSEYVFQETGREPGKPYEYTFYMIPVAYTVAPGHHLELQLMTWDPYRVFLDEGFLLDASLEHDLLNYNYSYTIDNQTMKVIIPTAK